MPTFLTFAALLGLTALFSYVNERFLRLQQAIGLMILALLITLILMSLDVLGLSDAFPKEQVFVTRLSLDETLLNGVLCFMLFAGSINVKFSTLREERWVILTLAIGATLIGAALIGLTIWWLLGLLGIGIGLIFALVFGALISPTDPIAALAILGKVGLPPKLEAIVNGESLFNDGVGVVIFTIFLAVAMGTQQPTLIDGLRMFLREVLGGVALGFGAAAVIHHMLVRTTDYGTHVLISLAVVSLGYGLAEHMEVSGPIAMVVTGLVVGNYSMPRIAEQQRAQFETFWQAIDEVLNAMLFVVIGLHVAVLPQDPSLAPAAGIAIIVCLGARWISVYLPLTALSAVGELKADRLGLTNLLTWGGLRGGLAIAMALSLPPGPEKTVILQMTYGVVAFAIIVQGLTISRLFKADQLKRLLG
jgi:CPA1 family monovalent cation:H+ antiporter